ncbi:head GIN domain-containing protein [Pelolinea submarina]|uniref:Putative autotransporter adhesin-like protein n=1 Tax=Pelolinea submarina TaxID=913107 RepID=A0A347ZRL1_9CHLR|nr:head GIN domain-containing protein [Pelolinea submarina]REG11502.1 putative autotransporter adhesin-like protein [Pelolinea submarina]BBB47942.1 hypothetical protein Pelsub_P1170 [Pelolinea submarina]
MKKARITACLLLLLLLSSCGLPVRMIEVRGSGQAKMESRYITGIQSVDLNGIGKLVITQGNRESLEITADENFLEYIQSDVSGKNLYLGVRENVNLQPTRDIVYHLTVKQLNAVETSGLGSIEIKSLETDDLHINISGAGNINIADLAADKLDMEISGLGNVNIAGKVTEQNIGISGAGNYQADDLYSRSAKVKISGTGSAKIWAADTLTLDLSGMGNVDYYGDPTINMDISGMGKVNSLGSK